MKTCFKCHRDKPLKEFYKHPMMGDGHLGKCKECTKSDVRKHRAENEAPREYDRRRYREDPKRKTHIQETGRRWAENYPEKRNAHYAVNNAVRDGRLEKTACVGCGATERVHGHHEDYSKPLDVIWMCAKCHNRYHHAKGWF